MLKSYRGDMHIHTCLSPCAGLEMSPKGIIDKCLEKGLDLIAVCDHNSMENTESAMITGRKKGVAVLPGMEICSREEVHILAVFGDPEHARKMQEYVYAHLPGQNRPDYFGDQLIVNENDEVTGENRMLLIGATTLRLEEIVENTHILGGLSIASHVDRPAFGIAGQLGFIPPDLPLDGVEVSFRMSPEQARKKIPGIGDLPCITSSDAHYPGDIGKAGMTFLLNAPVLEEIRLAMKGKGKRRMFCS